MKSRGETLSQNEIEALLASLPIDDLGGGEPAQKTLPGKQVRSWDFRKPDKFSKDHMRSLLALHQNFARLASTALSARLRTGVTIRVSSVDQGLYEEYIDLLPDQSVINVISLKPLDGNILFEFQAEMAMGMLDRLLGGSGGPVDPGHELTDIEVALVRNLVRTFLDGLGEAWNNLTEVTPQLQEISMSSQMAQVAGPADIVVIVLMEIQVGNRLGTLSMCIPHLVIEPVMHLLSAQVWVVSNRRTAASQETRDQLLRNLRRAPLRVTAVLGETDVSIDEFLRFQPGDVLMLGGDAVRTARVWIANQQRYVGKPGLVGGRMAVQITETEGNDDAGW